MKIAISSTGKNLESEVDPKFGRCAYFLIAEIKEKNIKKIKSIKNIAKTQMGGAGISAAQLIGNEKPDAIITMNMGPKAFQIFEQLKIKIYQGKGIIKNAVQDFIEGKLTEINKTSDLQHIGLK